MPRPAAVFQGLSVLRWIVTLAAACCVVVSAHADDLLVFAAASLKPALDEVIATPPVAAIGTVRASYAASSQLARQIVAGAPAALFISADQDWMDEVARHDLIAADSRTDLLGNALVLIAPAASSTRLTIAPGFPVRAALGADGRIALGEPNSVPAGKYARAAFEYLGVWDALRPRVVAAENVRAALNFVVRGEAGLGVVYRSDSVGEPAVRVLDTFPAATHAPIVYPVAIVREHDGEAARRLLAALHSDVAQAIFRRHGFDAPPARP